MTSGGSPDTPRLIRHVPDPETALLGELTEAHTGIIRRHPTGSFPVIAPPPPDDVSTSLIPRALRDDDYEADPRTPGPGFAAATATVTILSGWATAVIATSLIAAWWRTDELFCVAIAFLATISAGASIGGLIAVLLRRSIGRVLVVVGSVVALMIFAGLFVAGAELPSIVYVIPVLPVASTVLALLPGTARWCRAERV